MLRFFIRLAIIYVFVVVGIYFLQRHMLYYPDKKKPDIARARLAGAREITLKTNDNLQLLSWYIPPQGNKPIMVYFHGNSGHIGYRASIVAPYVHAGNGVLLLEYRGYGSNPGKPTEAGLYQDVVAAMDFIDKNRKNHCIILYGESLGNAPAMYAASQYVVNGAILQSAFSSIEDVAKKHYPFLPVSWLLKDKYDVIGRMDDIHTPLLFLHGTKDRIVPINFGKKLYDAANEPKRFVYFKGASHNTLHAGELFLHGQSFIEKVCPKRAD